jgi:glycosyltransferase involved in cell wall biosynthesis
MKLAVVVQRYGANISGGAELHARYVAERLVRHADVRVLTTCARDYVTWRNELPAGADTVNGVAIERFPVTQERDDADFGKRSTQVFTRQHSLHDELEWLESEGPVSPALIERVTANPDEFDFVVVFSARYYHAYHTARGVPLRTVLVPTAERDPALGLGLFGPVFRGVRAIMYNSYEERALIQAVSSNEQVPGVIVGVGSEIPQVVEPARVRKKFGLDGPYVIYVGRIDVNKGCMELFDFFIRYVDGHPHPPSLILIGTAVLDIPSHPRIRHLGFVDDQDKFDAIAGAAALIMPSYYESLSMVALEAWALGTPVIANARCDVLLGQCLRSNSGLYYTNDSEFAGVLDRLLEDPSLAETLGRNGREFFERNYSWPVIERKYLDMFAELSSNPPTHRMEGLPGWLSRRQRTMRPAAEIVDRLPSGPVIDTPASRGAIA